MCPIVYPLVQLLADILVIASQWRQYQTRLEGEKHLTVSTLDIIVDGGFSVLSEASTNPALCKEVCLCLSSCFFRRVDPVPRLPSVVFCFVTGTLLP